MTELPTRMLAVGAIGAALTLWGAAAGCRAARDPDLDQRVAAALVAKPEASTPDAPPPVVQAEPADPTAPPPKGMVELRTYSEREISELLGAVEGEGPTIRVAFETTAGAIHCALDHEAAPQAATNFVALASGQRHWRDPDTGDVEMRPLYRGLTFHRCISNFIAQTGNPGSRGAAGPGWTIPRETGIEGAYDKPGVMGMVDAGDDSHGSQFFITVRASKNLAEEYTPFGTCTDLEIVRAIANGDKHPSTTVGKSPTRPKDPIRILDVTLSRE